jgi:hypothetical protein
MVKLALRDGRYAVTALNSVAFGIPLNSGSLFG